jgi:hypothetical protein
MNVFLVLAALIALPVIGQAVRLIGKLLAWLMAVVFVMGIGMLLLIVLAEHMKLV